MRRSSAARARSFLLSSSSRTMRGLTAPACDRGLGEFDFAMARCSFSPIVLQVAIRSTARALRVAPPGLGRPPRPRFQGRQDDVGDPQGEAGGGDRLQVGEKRDREAGGREADEAGPVALVVAAVLL